MDLDLRPDQGARPGDIATADAAAGRPDAGSGCTDGDLSPLALHDDYCVTERLFLEGLPLAINIRGDHVWTLAHGTAKSFEVRRWQVDGVAAELVSPVAVWDFTVDTDDDVYAAEYLPVAADGKVAAGYNTADFVSPQGAVFFGAAGKQPAEVEANGNYDAAFLGESLLINGLGAGPLSGQGLYAIQPGKPPRKLIGDLGDLSGPVLVSDGALFAGGFFASQNQTRIFGFSRSEVEAALGTGSMLSATDHGDLVAAGNYFDATTLENDLVLASYDATFTFDRVLRQAITVDGDTLVAGTASEIVGANTSGSGPGVRLLVSDGARLGLVLVDDASATAELALIRRALSFPSN